MRKWKNKLFPIVFVFITVCVSLFSGCFYGGYGGSYRGAYTTAYSCIPGARGLWFCGPFYEDSLIVPLEKDENGRTMYAYMEEKGPLSVLIVQQETGDTAYYYPEDCFLSKKLPDVYYNRNMHREDFTASKIKALIAELYTDEEVSALKTLNDWNEPLQTEKCESATFKKFTDNVALNGRPGKIRFSEAQWRRAIKSVATQNGHVLQYNVSPDYVVNVDLHLEAYWMSTDEYGRELYYIDAHYYHYSHYEIPPRYPEDEGYSSIVYYLQMVAILPPNGSPNPLTFMMELDNLYTPQAQIKALKTNNGWNTPLQTEIV